MSPQMKSINLFPPKIQLLFYRLICDSPDFPVASDMKEWIDEMKVICKFNKKVEFDLIMRSGEFVRSDPQKALRLLSEAYSTRNPIMSDILDSLAITTVKH